MSNPDERIALLAEALRLGVRIEQTMRAYFTGGATPSDAGMRALAASRDAASAEQRALLAKLADSAGIEALASRVSALQPGLFTRADGLDRDRNHFIKAFRARLGRESADPAAKNSFDEAMLGFNRRKEELFREAAEALIRETPDLRPGGS